MAISVPVPKDLSGIKTKVALNLTKRQIICFSGAAITGVPLYFLTKGVLGTQAAALIMVGVMLPFFFFAMYEKGWISSRENIASHYPAEIFKTWNQVLSFPKLI